MKAGIFGQKVFEWGFIFLDDSDFTLSMTRLVTTMYDTTTLQLFFFPEMASQID